jgi:hypothetical protein
MQQDLTQREDKAKVEQILKQLKTSYEMYNITKKQTEKKLKEAVNNDGTKKYKKEDIKNELELINEAQAGVVEQYKMYGGDENDLLKKSQKSKTKTYSENVQETVKEMMANMEKDRKEIIEKSISATSTKFDQEYIPVSGTYTPDAAFDVIPLPSKGEGYKDKISKMSVAYLTAWDENVIVSPNLYRDNLILDYMLDKKLLSKEIDPMDLLEGDRDAIILFLRASGYGNEYPITATDDITGTEFDTTIDLSQLKYKKFELKGDSNGWFSFVLPISKKEVKFRFPTHRDIMALELMDKNEDLQKKKTSIEKYVSTLDSFIDSDSSVSDDEKIKIRKAIRTIEQWGDNIEAEEGTVITHSLTNKLNQLVMAIDGITDKNYISDFIMKMNVRDSTALRKYMTNNEPGIDYNITVQRPESLGGGSFETFLQLDQFLFLNIAD